MPTKKFTEQFGNQQLTTAIPNNFITRWMISRINIHLKSQNSRFALQIRYRKRKRNSRYSPWGDLQRKDARKLGLYLVDRLAKNKAKNQNAKDRRKWKKLERAEVTDYKRIENEMIQRESARIDRVTDNFERSIGWTHTAKLMLKLDK